jgi:GntR family transcriptional regulator, transcriptional repressor for pyruvate dehydrogenase complex
VRGADRDLSPVVFEAIFPPLDDGGRAQIVARRLARAIEQGHLSPGARLPTEIELAAQFSVSTITLREALATLRRDGLVQTRRGRGGGTFVCAAGLPQVVALSERVAGMSVDELRDLGDHCVAIRSAAIKLAAERASDDDLARLTEQLHLLERSKGAAQWRREEGRLHVEVAVAAHSARLARAELDLQEEAADLLLSPNHGGPRRAGTLERYRKVIDAIAAGEGPRAAQLVSEHVSGVVERIVQARIDVARR